jgi:FkbM family methyltransferase
MSDTTYGWNWAGFTGSAAALKWVRREMDSLDRVLKLTPGRTAAVQAGGSLGIFPKRLAMSFQTVYTFEPAPDLFAAMQVNATEANIIRFQAALGCARELVGVSRVRRDGKPDNHEGITHISGTGVIPTLTIDDLALPVCDLIYLDVEGYEYFAIKGAEQTIARCRPVIALEINKHLAECGIDAAELRQWVTSRGYFHAENVRSDEVYLPNERRVN